ncbi:MAG: ThiF family adenylyltransferase [Planctomycetota bacterium]|nr:ThiF family adenylyltransferase [Planctomycetota bacterium]
MTSSTSTSGANHDKRAGYSLSLWPQVWRRDILRLAARRAVGVGRLTRNYSPTGRELLVRELDSVSGTLLRSQYGARESLLLLELQDHVQADAALQMLQRFSPLPTQVVAALALGVGPAAGSWAGSVHAGNQVTPLWAIRLVGPGMRHIGAVHTNRADEAAATDPRWSRTRGALGAAVWDRVRRSRVAIIGAGRNGSACAFTLAMLGVSQLVLIDDDSDELHNLDATPGATPDGIGQPKVENRQRALLGLRPRDLSIATVFASVLDGAALSALHDVDLIVTAVDQDAPRLAIASWINGPPYLGKIHLDIGTGVFHEHGQRVMGGDVRLLLPGEACVACLGGLRDAAEARYRVNAPPGALPRSPRPAWNQQRMGSLITTNQVAVNLGVQLWLDLVAGRVEQSRWDQIRWADDGRFGIESRMQPDVSCEVCRATRKP